MPATLLALLDLPEVPIRILERPPLVLAVCELRFPRELSVADETAVAPFQKTLKGQYPILQKVPEVSVSVLLGPAATQVQPQSRSFRWEFTDLKGIWTVTLSQETLSLGTRTYASFGDFLDRLGPVVEALINLMGVGVLTRIGLRYINEIRLTDMAYEDAIQPVMLGPIAVPQISSAVAQAIQEILLRFDDGHGVNIRHGLIPEGTTVQPKPGTEPPKGNFYLLDFDAYRQFPLPGGMIANSEAVRQYVDTFNKVIYRLFRMATTDEYISTLAEHGDANNNRSD